MKFAASIFVILLAEFVHAGVRYSLPRADSIRIAVPYDQEVSYLESTGTQYLNLGKDIGIAGEDDVSFEVSFMLPTPSVKSYCGIFGAYYKTNSVTDRSSMLVSFNSQAYYGWSMIFGESLPFSNKTMAGTNYVVICRKYNLGSQAGCTVNLYDKDGVEIHSVGRRVQNSPINACELDYCVFAASSSPEVNNLKNKDPQKVRIYYLRIIRSGHTVHHLIPVVKSGEGMMYDRITGRLYKNVGTGSFVIGE